MDLVQFADSMTGSIDSEQRGSAKLFHALSRLYKRVDNDNLARTLVAHTFWQAYLHSASFAEDLHRIGLSAHDVIGEEPLVVYQATDRLNLLLTHRNPEFQPTAFTVNSTPDALAAGWIRALVNRVRRGERHGLFDGGLTRTMEELLLTPEIVTDAMILSNYAVIIMPRQAEEMCSTPSPAVEVDPVGAFAKSTAGAIVRDSQGRQGVTAAAHAVPAGASVWVGGVAGTVISHDPGLTDSCFIELSGPLPATLKSKGPLTSAPRLHDQTVFEGAVSGMVHTRILAASYELPFLDPTLMQTVRTECVTQPGDSGAGLRDSEDHIIGFARSRTSPFATVSYSAWIWADSVFHKHNLTVL